MNLDYTMDFIREYYVQCGNYKTYKEAYHATEDLYAKQYHTEIMEGRMKENKFADFNSFSKCLRFHLAKNKHKI